eukprot:scaffold6596_cov161-Amphora_coffeaeformis.AAC.13
MKKCKTVVGLSYSWREVLSVAAASGCHPRNVLFVAIALSLLFAWLHSHHFTFPPLPSFSAKRHSELFSIYFPMILDTMTHKDDVDTYQSFSESELLAAMAPQERVLEAFYRSNANSGNLDEAFATLVVRAQTQCEYPVCRRYIAHLVNLYINEHYRDNIEDLASESLLELYLTAKLAATGLPDPEEAGYCSFRIRDNTLLRIRIFPYHNDVSLKLWEAGAVLAEYLAGNHRKMIRDQRIVELGAGVGATGLALVVAGATHVLCTDYTERALHNMTHNFDQADWLEENAKGRIRAAHLDWNEESPPAHVETEFQQADLLIAADVAYDRTVLQPLVRTVRRFLQSKSNNHHRPKKAIFATTRRNLETFRLLRHQVAAHSIACRILDYHPSKYPVLFPKKFHQKRLDVELWELTLSENV